MSSVNSWIVRGAAALGSLAAIVGTGTEAGAQDFRQTIVVTAAPNPVPLGTVTRSMTVITRDEISQLPVQSVADVLRLATSLDVRARGERGVQTDFAVRGASFGQLLVLVDGVRLNDVQTGHHSGDIPVALSAIERVEVLYGAGASLYGTDAFGGTINIVTVKDVKPSVMVRGGSFGFGEVDAQGAFTSGRVTQAVGVVANRSSGFMEDRQFDTVTLRSRTSMGERSTITASFQRKAFGANNFYGGDAPSLEWTNQTLLAADRRFGTVNGWSLVGRTSYRTHGDRFVFTRVDPGLSDNRHRTHAVIGSLTASHTIGAGALTAGVEGGGDWIRSSNLGDHAVSRVSVFGDWRQAITPRVHLDAGLRLDEYSEFGSSWSPSVGVGWSPVARVRLRASAGRAFRIPSFTERFYSDPRNLADPGIGPETSWSYETGGDLFLSHGWVLHATAFGRADRDVIDWVRPDASVRWRTVNLRDVDVRGAEFAVRKGLRGGAFVQVGYTGMVLDAGRITLQSKYVLDYAPRSLVAAGVMAVPGGLHVAPRVEYRRRSRSSGRSDYVLLDARVSRRLTESVELQVDGTNLFDRHYQEIAGVDMPGAAMTVSVAFAPR